MYRKSYASGHSPALTFGRLKNPLRKMNFSMSDHGRTRLPSSFTWYGQLHPCGHGRSTPHSLRSHALRGRSRQRIGLPSVVSVLLCVTNLCLHGSCCRFDTSAWRVLKYSGSYASRRRLTPTRDVTESHSTIFDVWLRVNRTIVREATAHVSTACPRAARFSRFPSASSFHPRGALESLSSSSL